VAKLAQSEWDLVICDEAHKMSAHNFGNEVKKTKRYVLGEHLGEVTRHLLLMDRDSAQGGKARRLRPLHGAARLRPLRRQGARQEGPKQGGRRPRHDAPALQGAAAHMDGRPLFPERRAYAVKFALSKDEAYLYTEVTTYVREEDEPRRPAGQRAGPGRRAHPPWASLSPPAAPPGLVARGDLPVAQAAPQAPRAKLEEEKLLRRGAQVKAEQTDVLLALGPVAPEFDIEDLEELETCPTIELEDLEEQVVDQASADRRSRNCSTRSSR